MVFGHNSNVKFGAHTFHVQTEDRGANHALIDTTVYFQGRVLHRRTNNYLDLLPLTEDSQQAMLHVAVKEEGSGPVRGASVIAEIEGSDGHSPYTARTGDDGQATISFE